MWNYISSSFQEAAVKSSIGHTAEKIFTFDDLKKLSFLPNWKIENLKGTIDLFVNFISFQEMEPDIVKNYVSHIQRLSPEWILLRNMREGKQLASAFKTGVKKQIMTEDYVNYFFDYQLVKSSVLEFGFETVDGYNSELLILNKKK